MRWRELLIDAVVATMAFTISALIAANSNAVTGDLRRPDAFAYVLLALWSAAPVIRRAAPVIAVFGGLVAGVLYAALDYPLALTPVGLLSIYTAAAVLSQRTARRVLGGAVALSLLNSTLGPGATDPTIPALVVCAWLLGNYVGSRRAYAAELVRKNALLEQARLDLAESAVAEERLRIARELHDVVAHTMSVVALHAGTGRMVAEENPAAAREALATIETASRSALLEMRRLLGVLRGSDGEAPDGLVPAPGLDDLDALIAEVERSGVRIQLRIEGDRPDVPAGIDLSAYRIVQEALTNVIKHAGRAPTTVAVRYSPKAVTVEVDDEGSPGTPALPAQWQTGHGLVGMRERVAVYDGELDAGFRPTGGFHVAARLPFGVDR